MRDRDGIVLKHLDRMTDSTGLIQHAIFSIPRRESGYTTDDNARALRLCARLWSRNPQERMLSRVSGYLSFLEYAHRPGGGFHNFLSYGRTLAGCGRLRRLPGPGGPRAGRSAREPAARRLPLVGPGVDPSGRAHARRSAEPACAGVCDPGLRAPLFGRGRGCRTARERRLARGAAAEGVLPWRLGSRTGRGSSRG